MNKLQNTKQQKWDTASYKQNKYKQKKQLNTQQTIICYLLIFCLHRFFFIYIYIYIY